MPILTDPGFTGESPEAAVPPALCWTIDPDGGFTLVNGAAAAFFGMDIKDFPGRSWFEWIHPSDRESCREALSKALETGEPFLCEYRLRRRDGEYRWVLNTTTPEAPAGRSFPTTCFDITFLHKAAERLKIFALAAEQSQVSFLITDAAGNIEYVNPQFTATTGYQLDEVVGRNPRILKSGEMPPESYRLMWAELTAGRAWRGEFHNKRKDGSLFWEFAKVSPVRDREGKITHYFAVKKDITETKRLAAMLAEAQLRAEAAQRAKNEFLNNMNHELRTPMNGILGMAYLLRDSPDDPERDTYLRLLSESTEALLAFMSQLLELASLSEGAAGLQSAPFDVSQCIHQACGLFAAAAAKKGLRIETRIEAGVPPAVVGDSLRLGQVLANLIGNAVKFSSKGTISVKVMPDRSSGSTSSNAGMLFSVQDEGIGIPAEKLDVVFEPFEKADNSSSRKFGGAGAGLTIARRLVEAMGGRIWVVSRPGSGSTFYFTVAFQPLEPAGTENRSFSGSKMRR
jgi:PAS domain S-box-containing protein